MLASILLFTVGLLDAATADKDRFAPPVDADGGEYQLRSALWVPDTAVSKSAGDYRTISLKVGGTTLGSVTTNSSGGSDWVAGTPIAFTLTGGKSLEFTANTDCVEVDSTHTGSSGAVADGRVVLEFEKVAV